jgi:adenylyltransferase/sulfurtransferase
VIDVRERWELATGSIPGSVHVPLAEVLADAAGAAVRHRATQRRVVVVCQVGARARVAADALRAAGVDAVVLRGGIQGWVARQGSAS